MVQLEEVCKNTLKEIFQGDSDYQYIEGLVKLHLFSQFPQRKPWTLQALKTAFYEAELQVITLEDNNLLYAYLKFANSPKYLFVNTYSKNLELFEPVPTEEERIQWNK